MLLRIGLIKFFGLTWKDAVGWMLTLACFQRSPWLPLSDHTGPSEVVWPFCFRKAFSVPAWGSYTHRSVHTQINMIPINVQKHCTVSGFQPPGRGPMVGPGIYAIILWKQYKLEKKRNNNYRILHGTTVLAVFAVITWFVCPVFFLIPPCSMKSVWEHHQG